MFFNVIKAVAARGLFAIHAFVAVWRVVDVKHGDTTYWLLASTIGLLFIEGFVSICLRKGREMKWFCPSVFLYLCCIIPPTWIMELALVQTRRHFSSASSGTTNTTTSSGLASKREKLSQIPGLQFEINLELPADMWAKLLEQFLLVNLVIGRWLLPKGGLTRGQLSQLLLVYIGMAADIVELFEAFKEDVVNTNIELTCTVLALWSWSLMQFTLVLTATKARKPRLGMDNTSAKDFDPSSSKSCCQSMKRFFAMDIWAIMTTIIFQDGPFLCLRLLLICKYNVISYLNIFFTCKNSLVLILQVYRMSVLSIEQKKRKKVRLNLEAPAEASGLIEQAEEIAGEKPIDWANYAQAEIPEQNQQKQSRKQHRNRQKSAKKKRNSSGGYVEVPVDETEDKFKGHRDYCNSSELQGHIEDEFHSIEKEFQGQQEYKRKFQGQQEYKRKFQGQQEYERKFQGQKEYLEGFQGETQFPSKKSKTHGHVRPFHGKDRDDLELHDSMCLTYSQNKSAPWSNVSFTLSKPMTKLDRRKSSTDTDSDLRRIGQSKLKEELEKEPLLAEF